MINVKKANNTENGSFVVTDLGQKYEPNHTNIAFG